jgi:hypothetical protein
MEIYGNLRHEVEIDPIEVIKKLKTRFLGDSFRWVEEKNNKWFIMGTQSAGTHSFDIEIKEITKEELEYFEALRTVEKTLPME